MSKMNIKHKVKYVVNRKKVFQNARLLILAIH